MILSHFKTKFYLSFLLTLFSCSIIAHASDTQIIKLDTSHYIPLMIGEIEGKEAKLLFDTGSNAPLILNNRILQTLNRTKKTGKIRKSIDSSGKITSTHEVIIPKITLNSMVVHHIRTYPYQAWGLKFASEKNSMSNDKGLIADNFHEQQDGVVGIGMFLNKKLIIDYSNQRIIVFDSKIIPFPYNKKNWFKVAYQPSGEGLIISGNVNNTKASFLLDTGATASILKPTILRNTNQNLANLNFNNFKLKDHFFHFVEFQEPQTDGILGYNFFKDALILLDLTNQDIFLASL